jgi:hypothetical protein
MWIPFSKALFCGAPPPRIHYKYVKQNFGAAEENFQNHVLKIDFNIESEHGESVLDAGPTPSFGWWLQCEISI